MNFRATSDNQLIGLSFDLLSRISSDSDKQEVTLNLDYSGRRSDPEFNDCAELIELAGKLWEHGDLKPDGQFRWKVTNSSILVSGVWVGVLPVSPDVQGLIKKFLDGVSKLKLKIGDSYDFILNIETSPLEAKDVIPEGQGDWYCIVVAGVYRGKSKGPKGFERYKPYKYENTMNRHPIVYAQWFQGSERQAKEMHLRARNEMTEIGSVYKESGYLKSCSVVLWNYTKDQLVVGDNAVGTKGYLYDGVTCSNQLLKEWKIA